MDGRNYSEHARITAICVNLALDGVEADLRDALDRSSGEAAAALRQVLQKLKERRVKGDELKAASAC